MNSSPPQYVSAEPAAVLVFGADVLEGSGRTEGRPPHLPLQPAATDRGQLERGPVPGRLQSQADDARGSETTAESRKIVSATKLPYCTKKVYRYKVLE